MVHLIFGLKQCEVEGENSQRWTSWIHIQGNRNRNIFLMEKLQKEVSFKKHCYEVEAKGLLQLWTHGSMVKNNMDVDWNELLLLKGDQSQIKHAALSHEVRIHEVWILLQAESDCTLALLLRAVLLTGEAQKSVHTSFSYEFISAKCLYKIRVCSL